MLKNIGSLVFILLASNAIAKGGSTGMGNGGDVACEDRFNTIRDDIASWIGLGGSTGLTLPTGISLAQYNQRMLKYISDPTDLPNHPFKASVQCISDKVLVDGAEKACKNEIDQSTGVAHITCNTNRFTSTSDSDQYVLVHHEYAGLAGFEENTGTESDYVVSNQISAYLKNQVVKKLAIKPKPNWPNAFTAADGTIWSDTLPLEYANCISKKDILGNPIPAENNSVVCETDGTDNFDNLIGSSSDRTTVIDSDAIRACKAIGGELPTLQDFLNLGNDFNKLPDLGTGGVFWPTNLDSDPNFAMAWENTSGRPEFRGLNLPVRCVYH